MRTKLSVLMIIFLLTVTILTGCGTSSNVKNSEAIANEDRTFKVGLEAGYAPFNWTQMDDSNVVLR